jgi:hypothetical protein
MELRSSICKGEKRAIGIQEEDWKRKIKVS